MTRSASSGALARGVGLSGLLMMMAGLAACGSSKKTGSSSSAPPGGACTSTGQMTCSGACVDVATDANNCGTCGHSCAGAQCSGGTCQPLILASAQDSPYGITVDSTSVYWTNQAGAGSVLSVPIGGAGMPKVLAAAQTQAMSIVVDATGVYWIEGGVSGAGGGSVETVGLSGGTPKELGGMQGNLTYLVEDATTLYWTDTGNIWAVSKTAATGTAATRLVGGGNDISSIAVDATYLYWVDQGTSRVMKAEKATGQNSVILTSSLNPSAIAVDSTNIYVTDNLAIDRLGLDGTGVVTLAMAQTEAQVLVLDADNVYWPDPSDGLVMSVGKNGMNLTTLATMQAAPTDIAVDDTYVYWTNHGTMANNYIDGGVVRIPKPTAGTGGSTGGTSDTQLCQAACTTLTGCGVPLTVPSCTTACAASGVAVTCVQAAGSDCGQLSQCVLETQLSMSCSTSGPLDGTATCSATSSCELACIQNGSCNPLCSCVPQASADVALYLLINNTCFSTECATPCGSSGTGQACVTCFAQKCMSANQQCVAH
jgi:hypothetical protein